MKRWLVALLTAISLLGWFTVNAEQTPKRVGLVVGNGAYQAAAWRLANPPRDAALISTRLRSLGFDVETVIDGDRRTMERAFSRFGARLKAAGPEAVGFFYFAGHGAQRDGVNFLVPVDADATTSDRLRYQSPAMTFLLDDMAEAGNAVNIVVLDACRDMPLPDGARTLGRGGLADVGRLPNLFIAFATAPGRTAADGSGANSPFTAALAAALDSQSAEPIELLFSDINARVYRATAGGQAPEYRNGLVRAPRWSFSGTTSPVSSLQRSHSSRAGTTESGSTRAQLPPLIPGSSFTDCVGCPEMVVLPAGTLRMGSPAQEVGRDGDEGPIRTVPLRSVAVGKYEITFDEWAACVSRGGCAGNPEPNDHGWGRGRRPVVGISWDHAQEYVRWLSLETGQDYRLLTEPEWEYAARGGTGGRYSNNADESQLCTVSNHADRALRVSGFAARWGNELCSDGFDRQTAPVGTFMANLFGLHDMHGNVWEWVQDCWSDSYALEPTPTPVGGACSPRVIRGGSWASRPESVRSANRYRHTPNISPVSDMERLWGSRAEDGFFSSQRDQQIGFRVARALQRDRDQDPRAK